MVVIKSSSDFAQSEDRSNETQGGKDTTSTAKKGRFIQIILHSLQSHYCAKKSSSLSYDSDEFSFKNNMAFMMMQNQADKEQQDKELEMHRLELNAQREENRVQRQMMQMMMATLMSRNNLTLLDRILKKVWHLELERQQNWVK